MATRRVGSRRPLRGLPQTITDWAASFRASQPFRVVVVVGTIVFGLVIAGTIVVILEIRSREIADSRRDLATLNTILAEGTSRTLQSVDLVLRSITEEIAAEGIGTLEDLRSRKAGRATYEALRAKSAGLPQLNALSLVGSDGRLINFSRSFPVPTIDLSDRDHFAALHDSDVAEPYVSRPLQNRGTGDWSVYVARRLRAPDGAVVGLIYGAIELRYFERLYQSLALGQNSAISIWHQDGTLLVRYPSFDHVGKRFDTPAFRGLTPASPPVVYLNPAGIDGRERLVARRVVPDFPVASVVSRTLPDVLAEWRQQATVIALAGSLVAAAVLAVMAALARQFAAYEVVALAVRERQVAVQGRAEVEAQLRQSQKLEAMGQLTSGVAHDFNNLLTVVIGNLDLLGRRLPGELSSLRRHVDGARAGAERAAGLTQRLLAFSRRQALEPSVLDVNDLVRGMADLLRQTLGENILLTLETAGDVPRVFADPNQLEAALLNLVVNARDAMPGGGTVAIETRPQPDADVETQAETGGGTERDVLAGPRSADGLRHGSGHDARRPAARGGAVLHDQGPWARHRPGAGAGLRLRQAIGRRRRDRQHARRRHPHLDPSACHALDRALVASAGLGRREAFAAPRWRTSRCRTRARRRRQRRCAPLQRRGASPGGIRRLRSRGRGGRAQDGRGGDHRRPVQRYRTSRHRRAGARGGGLPPAARSARPPHHRLRRRSVGRARSRGSRPPGASQAVHARPR